MGVARLQSNRFCVFGWQDLTRPDDRQKCMMKSVTLCCAVALVAGSGRSASNGQGAA